MSRSRCFSELPLLSPCMIQQMLAVWSLVPLPFLNLSCTYGSSQFTYCWSLSWRILSITLLAQMSYLTSWNEHNCAVVWIFFLIALLWDWSENWPFLVLYSIYVFGNTRPPFMSPKKHVYFYTYIKHIYLYVCLVAQLCRTLYDPMDCSPPASFDHGILQARIQEWVAMPFSRGSSQPRDWIQVSIIAGRFFTLWATREAHI